MYGKGLIKGLKVSLGWFFRKKLTEQYPEVRIKLPETFHGKPEFHYDKCIACNQCVTACPNRVITLGTETVEKKKVVTDYDFNMQYCLFCGYCEEACPTDAIRFNQEFELTQYNRHDIKIKFVKPEQVEKKRNEVIKAAAEKEAAAKNKADTANTQAAEPSKGKEES